jgi:bis(5'-nucleosyl)-tetraphosphatase (symmetrical)
MVTYAIGDVQGCHRELQRLLEVIAFDPGTDRLWFTGDLVNRGPDSLLVLRFVRQLGSRAITVLGNHDLHLLACAVGNRKPRRNDTFEEILEAPDRDSLLQWLRACPLFHHDTASGYAMVHAGLAPQWDIAAATARAHEVERALRGSGFTAFLNNMYGNEPDRWSEDLHGNARLRFITNCLTRIRYCTSKGRLDLKPKGPPGTQGGKLMPWYAVPDRRSRATRILFGHWATLHLAGAPDTENNNVVGLDTGCVWGGRLTAMRLDDGAMFDVASETRAGDGD